MRFNLNDYIRVTLTEAGRDTLAWSLYGPFKSKSKEHANIMYPGWDTGSVRFQLWDAMRIFGPHMNNGADIPFVDNAIEIEAMKD